MNHLLFGFALCASLAIYPGGLAVLVGSLVGGAAQLGARRGGLRGWLAEAVIRSWSSMLGLALAGLVLAPMPWPDNPVAPVGISWAAGSNLGGIALSLSGLWALQLLGSSQPRRGWVLLLLGSWSVGLVLFALAVHSGSWSGILTAGGLGAEVARVGLAVLGLGSLPWVLWGAPGGSSLRGAAWAAVAGVALFLALPQLQSAPFPAVLIAWWALLAALGLAWAVVATWGPRLGFSVSAATLNAP
ncbi:MAG TPA: hypothetical protein VNH38_01545 [Candidatus Dormibacteraeota bacterium]|nr:hypothetical protein [Candidatus Dormibacteraeota bacterium]